MKGVFTTRVDPSYNDLPEKHYHFPHTYLNQVRSCVGDQIVYYEPGRINSSGARGGRQSYFAIAEVVEVVPDTRLDGHYYARMQNYLEFDLAVPFKLGEQTLERGLQKDDGSHNKGAFGRAVRIISDVEFRVILSLGFQHENLDFTPDIPVEAEILESGMMEGGIEFERPVIEVTQNRLFRDRAFARNVKRAYDKKCAFTGIKLINGMGRPEVQAAHIKPVAKDGPDSVRNGLALSSTFHWMFDRGLISLSDQFEFLLAKKGIPQEVEGLLNKNGHALVPERKVEQPHHSFLEFHRSNVFKG